MLIHKLDDPLHEAAVGGVFSARIRIIGYGSDPIFVFNDKDSSETKLMTKKTKSM